MWPFQCNAAILNGTAMGRKKEKRNCVHRLYDAQSKIKIEEMKKKQTLQLYNSNAYLLLLLVETKIHCRRQKNEEK